MTLTNSHDNQLDYSIKVQFATGLLINGGG